MREVKDVKSLTKPDYIDDTSSDTTVYMRYNIREIEETDPVFNTTKTTYVYDETQYTFAEWYKICMTETKGRIENLENIVKMLAYELNVSVPLK